MKFTKEAAGNYKRYIRVFLLWAVFINAITLNVFAQDEILPESISVSPKSATIKTRETMQLTFKVTPVSATDKTVEWISSDEDIAVVSQDGIVTGMKGGQATITAVSKNGVQGSCIITVKEVALKKIEISGETKTLYQGEKTKLKAVFTPSNATVQDVVWEIDEKYETVAQVDSEGEVTAAEHLKEDQAVEVTATVKTGTASGKPLTATYKITVKQTPIDTIRLTPSSMDMTIDGEDKEISFQLNPEMDIYDDTVEWRSSKDYVTVERVMDENGKVTNKVKVKLTGSKNNPVKPGAVTIIATTKKTQNQKTDTCIIHILQEPDSISCINDEERKMSLNGKELTLSVKVNPAKSSGSIIWEGKDTEGIITQGITVTSDGKISSGKSTAKVKALKAGIYKITAKSSIANKVVATFTVKVTENPPKSYTITPKKSIRVGESPVKLSVKSLNPTGTDTIWESDNPEVATISETGLVTGKKPGQAKISLKVAEDGTKDFCTVTVADRYDNGNFSKATGITNGTTISDASLYPEGDEDCYTFTLTAKSDITVNLTDIPEGCAYDLAVYKSSNVRKEVDGITKVAKDQKYKVLMATLDRGKYYIKVKAENKKSMYSAEYYKLQLLTGPEGSTPTEVKITGEPVEILKFNDMVKLTAEVLPGNAINKSVIWTSSNPTVATVTANGLVRVVSSSSEEVQTVVITARTSLGAREDTCTISVQNIHPESVKIYPEEDATSVYVNSTIRLTAVVTPAEASNKSVVWESDNSAVATVSADGVVTGKGEGEATITAKTVDGGKIATRTIEVSSVLPKSLKLSQTQANLAVNSTMPLTATVLPSNTTDKSVSWESSKPEVVAVYDGRLYGLSEGEAEITAISNVDHTLKSTCIVTVSFQKPTGVIVSPSTVNMAVDQTKKLSATVMPNTASDKSVVWSSSNESVATVDEYGVVTAVGTGEEETGTATITAKAAVKEATEGEDPEGESEEEEGEEGETAQKEIYGECIVTVSKEIVPDSIFLSIPKDVTEEDEAEKDVTEEDQAEEDAAEEDETEETAIKEATIDIGKTITLNVTVLPEDATNREVRWSSSDTYVATVSSSGVVTGKQNGTTVITAVTKSGSRKDFCRITVEAVQITKIEICIDGNDAVTPQYLNMSNKEKFQFTAKITPEDATYPEITWSNTDARVAMISGEGLFIPKKEGKTTVEALSADGKKEVCEVIVVSDRESPNKVSIKGPESIFKGRKGTYTATVSPGKCTNKQVTWKSDKPEIASVDIYGVVTAHKLGTVNITATTQLGNIESKKMKITVKPVLPSSLKITQKTMELSIGEEQSLEAVYSPVDISDAEVSWISSNPNVVTYDEKEKKLKAHGKGKAKVTATVISKEDPKIKKNEPTKKIAVCTVTVLMDPEELEIKAKKGIVSNEMKIGQEQTLKVDITPTEAAKRVVTWSSSDTSVAEVSSKGVVKAKGSGYVTITAAVKSLANITAELDITVEQKAPTSITLPKSLQVSVNESKTMTAKISPGNATKTLIWSSNNENVVTVDNGIITGNKTGTATITAYSTESNKVAAECVVTVVEILPSSVKITPGSVKNVVPEDTVQLTAVVAPGRCSNKKVTWESSNEEVATVEDGLVKMVSPGEAVIKVTTEALGTDKKKKSASLKIVVKPRTADSLTISPTTVILNANQTYQLTPTVAPLDKITNNIPNWKSADSKIAVVSDKGVVTAMKIGTTNISVTVGGKTAICKVTVITNPAKSISLAPAAMTLSKGEQGKVKPTVEPKTAEQGVSYKSSNENVARIADDGTITAAGVGISEITARSDAGNHQASCIVTVYEDSIGTLSKDIIELKPESTVNLGDMIDGGQKKEQTYGWTFSSSDTNVVSVDSDGNMTGINFGRATVTAFTAWGEIISFTVKVT